MDLIFQDMSLTLHLLRAVKVKRKYPVRKTNPLKRGMKLSKLQQEVLVGTLLGDSSLERPKSHHNTRLRFEQSFPHHASYLISLFGIFYNLTSTGPSLVLRKPDKRTGKVYPALAFKTMTLPCFNQ